MTASQWYLPNFANAFFFFLFCRTSAVEQELAFIGREFVV